MTDSVSVRNAINSLWHILRVVENEKRRLMSDSAVFSDGTRIKIPAAKREYDMFNDISRRAFDVKEVLNEVLGDARVAEEEDERERREADEREYRSWARMDCTSGYDIN